MRQFLLVTILLLSSFTFLNAQTQNSLDFDHSDDYVQTTYSGISGSAARTVEAWIKTPFVSGQEVITDWGTASTGGRFTFALINGKLRVEVHGSGVTSPTVVSDTQWHHVAVTFDPSATLNYRTYLDGQLDSAFNISTAINTGSSVDMRIGLRIDGTKPFSGNIDEVRVWNYTKTQAELDSLNDEEICGNHTGLVAYYRFNHGTSGGNNSSVTTLMDHTISGNDGTLNNFSLGGSTSNWVNGVAILGAPDSDTTFSVTACGAYGTPGGQYITTSQTVVETIPNAVGCDSVLTIHITINKNSSVIYNIDACDSFVSPSGNNTWYSSGLYTETFPNSVGCDSVEQFYLNIGTTSNTQLTISSCESYTSPSTKYTWTSTGLYRDTLNSQEGCDSILIIDLTIHNKETTTRFDTACVTFTSPGGQVLTQSGTYFDTMSTVYGCDSFITIELVINQVSDTTLTVANCDSVSSESGQNTWFTSGTYYEMYSNRFGCDSTVEYKVTILKASTGSINETACGSYTSPSGKVLTATGLYSDTIPNHLGCDSVISIVLNLTKNNPKISEVQGELRASLSNKNYRWLDCADGFSVIPNETAQTFTPSKSGLYAVEVEQNDCRDTSECLYLQHAGIEDLNNDQFVAYPVPSHGSITVKVLAAGVLSVTDVHGKLVEVITCYANSEHLIQLGDAQGIFYFEYITNDGVRSIRKVSNL